MFESIRNLYDGVRSIFVTTRTSDFRNAALPDFLSDLLSLPGTFPSDKYEGTCTGATRLPGSTSVHPRWSLDTTRYTHHPAENYKHGHMIGFTNDLTDHHGVVAVKSLELLGNGEMERYNWFWMDVAKYGNIYLIVTSGECQNWSPVPNAVGSDPFRKQLQSIRFVYDQSQEIVEREVMGCEHKIMDYKVSAKAAAVSILPGPYPTHTPSDDATYNQCEFGMHHQSMDYMPPKPVVDTATLPAVGALYCVRLMESDHIGSDTVLLQATLPLAAFTLSFLSELTIAHDITDQYNVLYNSSDASLAKISFVFTP